MKPLPGAGVSPWFRFTTYFDLEIVIKSTFEKHFLSFAIRNSNCFPAKISPSTGKFITG